MIRLRLILFRETCHMCKQLKPSAAFTKDEKNNSGLRCYCRDCVAIYDTGYRAMNRLKLRTYHRRWREKNPSRRAVGDAAYRNAHRAEIRARNTRWAKANRDTRNASWARHLARKRNAPGRGVSSVEWRQILAESLGLCAYCNRRPTRLTQDHIEPLAGGGEHDVTNISAVCPNCNYSKTDSGLLVWLARRALGLAA